MKIFINCKFRTEILVPLWGISPNVEFLSIPDREKREVLALMKDGVLAEVTGFENKTIFEFEDKIKELYKTEPYEWLRKWYQASDGLLSSIEVCHIYLKKHETKEEVENGVSEED